MTDTPLIVGLGEALYDLLPVGPVLGGAPLNAAVQAHQIGRFLGGYAVMASRIGTMSLVRRWSTLCRRAVWTPHRSSATRRHPPAR